MVKTGRPALPPDEKRKARTLRARDDEWLLIHSFAALVKRDGCLAAKLLLKSYERGQ